MYQRRQEHRYCCLSWDAQLCQLHCQWFLYYRPGYLFFQLRYLAQTIHQSYIMPSSVEELHTQESDCKREFLCHPPSTYVPTLIIVTVDQYFPRTVGDLPQSDLVKWAYPAGPCPRVWVGASASCKFSRHAILDCSSTSCFSDSSLVRASPPTGMAFRLF